MPAEGSVPTLSIGGFLGAGKTTLINHMLRQANGRRIVVFVNDFGAINIDYELIETVETDRVSLANGCVCCSLNDDLIRSMVEFCETDRPDCFVIEASGVSNPRSLDQSLLALQRSGLAHMQKRLYMIDTDQFGRLDYADTEDLVDHAAASELVVLNKTDLAKPDQVVGIRHLLSRSAPRTEIRETTYGGVPMELILHEAPSSKPSCADGPVQPHDLASEFQSVSFAGFPALTEASLEQLTIAMKSTCIRAKGFIYLEENPTQPVEVQLVGNRLLMVPSSAKHGRDDRSSSLVAIGRPGQIDPTLLGRVLGAEPVVV